MPAILTPDQLTRDLAIRDLTDPAGGSPHRPAPDRYALTALSAVWAVKHESLAVREWCHWRTTTTTSGSPQTLVTRDACYTRNVGDNHMLRSHASAMVRLRLRRKVLILSGVLAASLFPSVALVPPLYEMWRTLGLLNTYPGLYIPYVALPCR